MGETRDDSKKTSTSAAMAALAAGDIGKARSLCREVDLSFLGEDGWSCLHWAVHVAGMAAADADREEDEDEERENASEDGCGCCIQAPAGSRGVNVEVVRLLLETPRKEDVNLTNSDGATALMFAADAGDEEICNLLLAAGADKSLKDEDGDVAAQWA